MRLVREAISRLEKINVEPCAQPDFDAFWEAAKQRVANADPALELAGVDYPVDGMTVQDMSFSGLDGTRVAAWYLRPAGAKGPLPLVVQFHGGNGHRGRPFEHAAWVMAGFAVMTMDFRQQGGRTGSKTPMDNLAVNHWVTMNIEDHRNAYFYHAWTDALIGLRAMAEMPDVDGSRIVVSGASQGGGVSLVMAALSSLPALCVANVPSYCWWEQRVNGKTACAAFIADYIRRYPQSMETVFKTLSYFDVVHFADRIRCPVYASCCLSDPSTPPECVYAAYNRIRSEKRIDNCPYEGHAVPPSVFERQMGWVRGKLGVGAR